MNLQKEIPLKSVCFILIVLGVLCLLIAYFFNNDIITPAEPKPENTKTITGYYHDFKTTRIMDQETAQFYRKRAIFVKYEKFQKALDLKSPMFIRALDTGVFYCWCSPGVRSVYDYMAGKSLYGYMERFQKPPLYVTYDWQIITQNIMSLDQQSKGLSPYRVVTIWEAIPIKTPFQRLIVLCFSWLGIAFLFIVIGGILINFLSAKCTSQPAKLLPHS